MEPRRVRIGIDTGGTFTDVVAVDEATGRTTTTKTPSTPADPAEGFLTGVRKVLDLMGLSGEAVTAVSHGTTVATNQLLEGKLDRIGFITTEGYESVLEIARQSVPDGYGNAPCAAGSTTAARRCGRSTGTTPAPPPAPCAPPGWPRSASASCTPTRTTSTSAGCSTCCARSTPTRW
jgi:hypothetical protein